MLLICFGTRPEWIKLRPILRILPRSEYLLYFTGQHTDLLAELDHEDIDYRGKIGAESVDRLDNIIRDALLSFPNVPAITKVLVQGDTSSAFACALAAYHRHLTLFYLEAGLRSHDVGHPFPEEGFRQMIARLADVNFATTELAADNLRSEQVHGKIIVTGNVALDDVVDIPTAYDDICLITLHRRNNIPILADWFSQVEQLATHHQQIRFILPLHPNPDAQRHRAILRRVEATSPLPRPELLAVLARCKCVITDSGGIQEEAECLNKRVIICRHATERPEALANGQSVLCPNPNLLQIFFNQVLANYRFDGKHIHGDGLAAQRVVGVLMGG
ncbi:MAG: UDP-N-acetylglucosamine 2-epimerase [Alphaproteobacteria bacterium]|nr:UDP-N-acetylglucosamine 2-epimerase [Alphaproteobacteria bacterium]